jgi:hypothetical protein
VKTRILLALLAGLTLATCDNRTPLVPHDGEDLPQEIHIVPDDDTEIIAQADSLLFYVAVVDSNLNLIGGALDVRVKASDGFIVPLDNPDPEDARLLFRYTYSHAIDSALSVELVATTMRASDSARVADTLLVNVVPQQRSVGYLSPAAININPRTDTASIYMAGGEWVLFVYAVVMDSLSNPIDGKVPVVFSLEHGATDSSQVSITNLARTSVRACAYQHCDSVGGSAISVLSYDSRAILDTVVIRAAVQNRPEIRAVDTLILPVPTKGLKLSAKSLLSGPVVVGNDGGRGEIEVSLRDAYNVPIAGASVRIDAEVNHVLPNCYDYDSSTGLSDGSEPCACDTLAFYDSCVVWNSSAYAYDTLCAQPYEIENCSPLPDPFAGVTDRSGKFVAFIWVTDNALQTPDGDPAVKADAPIVLREESSGYTYSDFELSVVAVP